MRKLLFPLLLISSFASGQTLIKVGGSVFASDKLGRNPGGIQAIVIRQIAPYFSAGLGGDIYEFGDDPHLSIGFADLSLYYPFPADKARPYISLQPGYNFLSGPAKTNYFGSSSQGGFCYNIMFGAQLKPSKMPGMYMSAGYGSLGVKIGKTHSYGGFRLAGGLVF